MVGLSPKCHGYNLVYAMKVEEALSTAAYWYDVRFQKKRPNFETPLGSLGDNIYEPLDNGGFRQHRSHHSTINAKFRPGDARRYTDAEAEEAKKRDLSVKRVLVATEFAYFGPDNPQELDDELRNAMSVGRGYRSRFSPDVLRKWHAYIASLPRGLMTAELPQKDRKCETECMRNPSPKITKNASNSRASE